MKIFLDDLRQCPEIQTDFNIVRNYEDCIIMLEAFGNEIEFIDMDFDLGDGKTGLDVLKYMHEHNIKPERINIHSDHPKGIYEMRKYANDYFKNASVTCSKL